MRIVGTLANAAHPDMRLSGPNFTTGFYASAVDLGRLQVELNRGIARLSSEQVEQRWAEVFDWMRRVLKAWVQRCKRMKIERRANGIHIELETQDDHGYYRYEFDVFPGRGH